MPSVQLITTSGGQLLMSGNPFSGSPQLVGGVQLRFERAGSGVIYVGLPNLSGTVGTINSGGVLSSGGLADAMEIGPGDGYFVPKTRLVSGIETIRVLAPAGVSGQRLYWEVFSFLAVSMLTLVGNFAG